MWTWSKRFKIVWVNFSASGLGQGGYWPESFKQGGNLKPILWV